MNDRLCTCSTLCVRREQTAFGSFWAGQSVLEAFGAYCCRAICIWTAGTCELLAKRTTSLMMVLGLSDVRVGAPFAEESAFILLPSSSRMSSLLHAFSSGPGRYSVLAGPNSGQ